MVPSRLALRAGVTNIRGPLRARVTNIRGVITSTRASFEPQTGLLPHYLVPSLERYSERTAIVDHVAGTSITHGDILATVGGIANLLQDRGMQYRDHVAVCCYNHLYYFPLTLGIIAAGGIPAFCNPGYVEREMEGLFVTGNVNMAIGHHKNTEVIQSVCNKLGLAPPTDIDAIVSQCRSYSSVIPSVPGVGTHDTCCLFYSSGTTGFPKAVETTHSNYLSQLMLLDDSEMLNFSPESNNNGFLPSFHALGNIIGMHVLDKGASSVCLDGFSPQTFLESTEEHKVTFAVVVPPVMVFLAKHPLVDQYDLSSLTDIMCAAAPLSNQLERDVKARLSNDRSGHKLSNDRSGHKLSNDRSGHELNIRQSYGMSETFLSHYVSKGVTLPGSIGGVGPNHLCKIVDSELKEVPQGTSGEILIKGPCVMKGYLNNPKATEETITSDGWLRTGDIGYADEHDNFYIIDRLKEFIKVKGFQVAPAELEALLLEHPLIADAAVIGIADERAGERPKAFVVKAAGVELSDEDVKKFVGENATDYKVPSQVEFIDVIPKLPSGKIQRKDLRLREKAAREADGQ